MKIGVIIQARTGSTRLPNKVLMNIEGKTVLEHVVNRVKKSKLIDEIIIATTIKQEDSIIELESKKYDVKIFRGSEEDVLSRYYYAAKENNLEAIVRITSDCPLIDAKLIDKFIECYKINKYELISNAGAIPQNRTYPRGLDIELFSFKVLEDAFFNAKEEYQREHVTPYIYEVSKSIFYYKNDIDYSDYRLTLDTRDDFKLISEIYKILYKGKHNFYMEDIINLLKENPYMSKINAHIQQKQLKEN